MDTSTEVMRMRRKISFSKYQDSVKKLKNMSYNEFNRWVISLWEEAYKDGYGEALLESHKDVMAEITDEDLLDIMLSVKGIGRKRAEEVIVKVMERNTLTLDGLDGIIDCDKEV